MKPPKASRFWFDAPRYHPFRVKFLKSSRLPDKEAPATMSKQSPSSVDFDETVSTAPTTPEASLTFSPVLQPSRFHDAFEETAKDKIIQARGAQEPLLETAPKTVKNICCVGAGYVGM